MEYLAALSIVFLAGYVVGYAYKNGINTMQEIDKQYPITK